MLRGMILSAFVVAASMGSPRPGRAGVSATIGIDLPGPPELVPVPGTAHDGNGDRIPPRAARRSSPPRRRAAARDDHASDSAPLFPAGRSRRRWSFSLPPPPFIISVAVRTCRGT